MCESGSYSPCRESSQHDNMGCSKAQIRIKTYEFQQHSPPLQKPGSTENPHGSSYFHGPTAGFHKPWLLLSAQRAHEASFHILSGPKLQNPGFHAQPALKNQVSSSPAAPSKV